MPDSSLDIAALLSELGFESAEDQRRARQVLTDARLTREGKQRIAAEKRARVEELLDSRFHVTCGAPDCTAFANGREPVRAETITKCRVCGGSANRRAIDAAREAFRHAGIKRVVIVGGSPALHDELRRTAPDEWELRLIDGSQRRTLADARADLRWADIVLVWGGTILDHKVSELYTHAKEASRGHIVKCARRSIAALLDEGVRHAARRKR